MLILIKSSCLVLWLVDTFYIGSCLVLGFVDTFYITNSQELNKIINKIYTNNFIFIGLSVGRQNGIRMFEFNFFQGFPGTCQEEQRFCTFAIAFLGRNYLITCRINSFSFGSIWPLFYNLNGRPQAWTWNLIEAKFCFSCNFSFSLHGSALIYIWMRWRRFSQCCFQHAAR